MAKLQEGQVWRLSPSDLYLYGSCRRCFWLDAVHGIARPRGGFPVVFGLLDRQTKDHLCSRTSQDIAPGVAPGTVLCRDRSVRSLPLEVPGHSHRICLTGRLDTALSFGDASFGVIDFKTTVPRPQAAALYADQLAAYAIAVENPDGRSLFLSPVSQIGIVCVQPLEMLSLGADVAFRARPTFIEIERDDERFFDLLSQVLLVLGLEEPPEAMPGCPYCTYQARWLQLLVEHMQHGR
jgi:hypothetical protein